MLFLSIHHHSHEVPDDPAQQPVGAIMPHRRRTTHTIINIIIHIIIIQPLLLCSIMPFITSIRVGFVKLGTNNFDCYYVLSVMILLSFFFGVPHIYRPSDRTSSSVL